MSFTSSGHDRSIYRLEDQMFRFWYRFVFTNLSAIIAGLGDAVFDNEIEPQLNAYMGLVFEDICKQWLFEQAKKGNVPFFIGNIGRWWGSTHLTRTQEEVDIMATRKDAALFAECKWSNADIGIDVYNDLKRKSEMFQYKNIHLYIFAKGAFTGKLLKVEHEQGLVKLFSLSEMLDAKLPATVLLQ